MFITAKKRIIERVQAASQNFLSESMPTISPWFRKWFTGNPFVVCFNESH